jgi:hypothetical protein
MSTSEVATWLSYFKWKNAEEKKARDQAQAKARARGGRGRRR